LRRFNLCDLALQLAFQAPWFELTPREAACKVRTSVVLDGGAASGVQAACLGWWRVLGAAKEDMSMFNGAGAVTALGYPSPTPLAPSFAIYVWLLFLWHVVDSPPYAYVRYSLRTVAFSFFD